MQVHWLKQKAAPQCFGETDPGRWMGGWCHHTILWCHTIGVAPHHTIVSHHTIVAGCLTAVRESASLHPLCQPATQLPCDLCFHPISTVAHVSSTVNHLIFILYGRPVFTLFQTSEFKFCSTAHLCIQFVFTLHKCPVL